MNSIKFWIHRSRDQIVKIYLNESRFGKKNSKSEFTKNHKDKCLENSLSIFQGKRIILVHKVITPLFQSIKSFQNMLRDSLLLSFSSKKLYKSTYQSRHLCQTKLFMIKVTLQSLNHKSSQAMMLEFFQLYQAMKRSKRKWKKSNNETIRRI